MIKFVLILSLFFANSHAIMLLEKYKDQNISGFVMSEKLDGIRGYWDGKKLLSRNGKTIHAPAWWLKDFPPFSIDGEIYSKRQDFEFIQSVVMDKNPSKDWEKLRFHIFEVPHVKGSLFERLNVLESYLKAHPSKIIRIIPQRPIRSKIDMQRYFAFIKASGGEGVVLRDPKAPYIDKRTNKVLKYKGFDDDECKVISHHKGEGKYKNLLGSFTCELANGVRFKIGSGLSDKDRQNPPKIGQIISFKYNGLSKYGKPRFPVFLHAREDVKLF